MGQPTDPFQGEPLHTVPEVAALLRTSTPTVYRWIRVGVLDAFKVGREYRIKKSVLDAYLAEIGFITAIPAAATA